MIGAGAMASLAVAHLSRSGAASISVLNRTAARAERLAAGVRRHLVAAGRRSPTSSPRPTSSSPAPAPPSRWSASPTWSPRAAAATGRSTVIDLALPHDVDPSLADLPGVELINLAGLADELRGLEATAGVDDVRTIVGQEISAFLAVRRQASVTPTVVALRSMATSVVDAEMERLSTRLPGLDDATRAEVLHTVRRVADKLLHEPTVRVKELADAEPAVSYTAALAELFRLDPDAVDAISRAEGQP